MKLKFPFFISIVVMQFGLYGQPTNYSWTAEFDGNFSNTRLFIDGAAGASFRALTIQATDNSSDYVIESDNFDNKWQNTDSPLDAEFTLFHGGNGSPNGVVSSGATAGKYYTFQIEGLAYSNRNAIIMETTNAPVNITDLSFDDNVFFDDDVEITITLSDNKSTEERVFIRYTDDNYNTTSLTEVNFSTPTSSTGIAIIPNTYNTAGRSVEFYAYSTTVSATSTSNHDLISLRIINNLGANYSYTVRSEYITQTDATDWNDASSWRANQEPPNDADVIIAHDLNLTDNQEVQNLTINSGATLTFSNDETLDIQDSGSFTNNGTINHANGILNFLGGGSILGTLSLNDVILNNGGVSFGENSTIEGSLLLNPGGFVDSDSPIYGTNSTLIYNTENDVGTPYGRRSEWSNAGIYAIPNNVIIQNNTTLNMGADEDRRDVIAKITGDLTIEEGSSLFMDFDDNDMEAPLIVEGDFVNNGTISLSQNTFNAAPLLNGDLKVFGNFTNTGTFNFNDRALFFEGAEIQELNASTVFDIPFLVIAKDEGEVTLYQNIKILGNGDGLQMSDQGILNLNGHQLQIGNDTNTGVLFNNNSALKGSTDSKVVFKSTANTGDLKFIQSDFGNYLSEFEMDGSGNIGVSDTLNILRKFHLNNGTFISNGNLTFKSSDSITAIIPEVIDGTINGDVRIERYFSNIKRSFRYVSSPINSTDNIHANWQEGVNNSNTSDNENPHPGFGTHITGSQNGDNGFDATQTGNPSMFTWDAQSQMWNSIPNTNNTNLLLGKAYALMVRGDRSTDLNSNNAIGAPTVLRSLGTIQTGQYSVPAEEMPNAADEFALIGNPYQAQVDVTQLNKNGLNPNYIYIWDPNLGGQFGGYTAVDLSDENNISSTPNSEANELLQPSQAFFIETEQPTSSVTFEEAHKVDNVSNVQTFSITETPQIYIALQQASAASILDATRVVFGDSFSNEVTNEDGKKLWNFSEYLAIEKFEKWLSVEKKPLIENDTTQLFTGNYQHQNYQLQLEVSHLEDAEIHLVDQYLETTTLLESGDNTYAFSVDQSNPESTDVRRFQLITEHTSLATQTITQPQITVYPNPVSNGILNLVWPPNADADDATQIHIHDVLGKVVVNQIIISNESVFKIDTSTLATGIYLLKATRGASHYSTKIVVE